MYNQFVATSCPLLVYVDVLAQHKATCKSPTPTWELPQYPLLQYNPMLSRYIIVTVTVTVVDELYAVTNLFHQLQQLWRCHLVQGFYFAFFHSRSSLLSLKNNFIIKYCIMNCCHCIMKLYHLCHEILSHMTSMHYVNRVLSSLIAYCIFTCLIINRFLYQFTLSTYQ